MSSRFFAELTDLFHHIGLFFSFGEPQDFVTLLGPFAAGALPRFKCSFCDKTGRHAEELKRL